MSLKHLALYSLWSKATHSKVLNEIDSCKIALHLVFKPEWWLPYISYSSWLYMRTLGILSSFILMTRSTQFNCDCMRKVSVHPIFHFVKSQHLYFLFHPQIVCKHSLWKISSWLICDWYDVHFADPYKSMVWMTSLYTWIFVPRFKHFLYQRQWWSLPNVLVALAIHLTILSLKDELEFTLLLQYVKNFKYLRFFLSILMGEFGNWWFCLGPLICFGRKVCWWTTSIFLMTALPALE